MIEAAPDHDGIVSRPIIINSKSPMEQGVQLWLPEVQDPPTDGGKTEMPVEALRWRQAAFRFRLVGITDMRGSPQTSERPTPPTKEIPNKSPKIEGTHAHEY
jgi:hypothetical protein